MSDFNLQWLAENFKNQPNLIFFDIGAAHIGGDFLKFKKTLPNGKFYAFECGNHWKEHNFNVARYYNLNYYHVAVSDTDGVSKFYQSINVRNKKLENYSGRLNFPDFGIDPKIPDIEFNNEYEVKTIKLSTFCKENNVYPDIIHIDVEKSEHLVFQGFDDNIRPKCIWTEIGLYSESEFNELNSLLISYGYILNFKNSLDALYVLKGQQLTKYYSKENSTEFYEELVNDIWIDRYNLIRGVDWPKLQCVLDFYFLPEHIQKECVEKFNFSPDCLYDNDEDTTHEIKP